MSLTQNKGKYLVGNISEYGKKKGWFFGFFADNPLLKSDLVEIGWNDISNSTMQPQERHIHKLAVEINIIVSGSLTITIQGKKYTLFKKDFYIIWPDTIIEAGVAGPSTEIIVIKSPSLPDDKFFIPM